MKTIILFIVISFSSFVELQAGIVDVNYNVSSGSSWKQHEKDAFERAAKHWADVLTPKHNIRVDAYFHDLYTFHGSKDSSWFRVLGYANTASADPNLTSHPKYIPNTNYATALVEEMAGSNTIWQTPIDYHITIHFNSSQNWYFGEDFSSIGPREYDFTTVVLHELAHGLGFNSSARFDSTLNAPVYNAATPIIMDRFVYKNLGAVDMTSLPASGSNTTSFLTSNSLFFKGSEASSQNGGNRPKIYAPSSWVQGSSLSHWDLGYFGSLNKDKLMEPQAGFANSHFFRQVGKVTRGFMSDIGWDVTMSMNEEQLESFVSVFPNPTSKVLNVQLDDDIGSVRVIVRASDGSVYYLHQFTQKEKCFPLIVPGRK